MRCYTICIHIEWRKSAPNYALCSNPCGYFACDTIRTSLFIITSLVYAMLLIVVCIAYVISDVSTHKLPIIYYEGFFTYLFGASILFLLYVFCFLLQGETEFSAHCAHK